MSDNFKPWRRKAGVVLLAMACASATGWIRSQIVHDLVAVGLSRGTTRQHVIATADGEIGWFSRDLEQGETGGDGCFLGVSPQSNEVIEFINSERQRHSFRQSVLAYWQLTLVPTLLSAWLLIWPMRRHKPPIPRTTI